MEENQEFGPMQKRSSMECEDCHGTGFVTYTVNGYQYAQPCQCGINEKKKPLAELPEPFQSSRLQNFRLDLYTREDSRKIAQKNIDIGRYWIEHYDEMKSEGQGMYVYSKAKGSGKTRYAVSLANELNRTRNVAVKFVSSPDLLNEIAASWNKDNNLDERQLIQEVSNVEVLIIDDFGMEKVQPWIMGKYYQIINTRYIAKLVTIFTSNLSLDELTYDERITSRIMERSYTLAFPEESLRRNIHKKKMDELIRAVAGIKEEGSLQVAT